MSYVNEYMDITSALSKFYFGDIPFPDVPHMWWCLNVDYGPYTPSHKKDQGTTVKAEETVKYPFAAAARSHRQCRCHPPHHKYNFIPSRPVHHLQRYLRPNVGRGTALLLLYLSLPSVLVLVPAIYACTLYMSVSSGLVLCHLLLLCRSSVIPLCPTIPHGRHKLL